MIVWFLWLTAAFAECPEGPVKAEALRATLGEASDAAIKGLGGTFNSSFKTANQQIGCLDGTLAAKDVALVLRVAAAKSAMFDKDPVAAAATVREATRVSPADASDPLAKALAALPPPPPATPPPNSPAPVAGSTPTSEPVRAPDRTLLTLNGTLAATQRPLDAWVLVQARRIDDGMLRISALVPPKASLPAIFPPPIGEDPGLFLTQLAAQQRDDSPAREAARKAWPDAEKAALAGKLDALTAFVATHGATNLPVIAEAKGWLAAGDAWTKARAEAAATWKATSAALGKGIDADRAALDAFLLAWTNKKLGSAVFVTPEVSEAWKALAGLPPEPPRHWQVRTAEVRRVDGGVFKDGSRTVTLTRPFAILEAPVTRGWWASATGGAAPGQPGEDRDPVRGISWLEAVAFANAASVKDGLTPAYDLSGSDVVIVGANSGWRLPTEAEWTWAKKTGVIVPGSGEWLYDEHSEPTGDATDPVGPASGKAKKALHVIVSAGDRRAEKPTTKAEGVGLRLVRTLPKS